MERETTADRTRFLTIAKASCGELRTQIYIGMEINYIDREQGKHWIQETQELSAMLIGLSRSLKS